jgi:tetratricopeptide (TPR) repeat protein
VPQTTVAPPAVDTAEPSPYAASSLYGVRTPQANPTAAAPVAVAPDASSPVVSIAPQSPLLVDLERRSAAAGGHAEAPVISSLATGIQPAALASLMEAAEAQMRSGQFVHAIATYGSAGRLAPDNPLVVLGRAYAELGAGYYGRAEADLAAAVEVEPALLVGRYDLVKFLGSDRLSAVRKELVDLAATEPAARPFTLLAFIGHNTGDTDTAVATNLDTAQTRGADAHLLDAMRSAWHLPAAVQK